MQNKKLHNNKKIIPSAIKVLITLSSLAGTIGIWNILANKDAQTKKIVDEIQNPEKVILENTPKPIPTIASLVFLEKQTTQIAQSIPTPAPTPTLRDVTRPQESAVIVDNSNPVIIGAESVDQSVSSNSAPPAPVTTTRSSRP